MNHGVYNTTVAPQGVNLPGTDAWLDPPHRAPFAVWCNPSLVGVHRQSKLLCTTDTARLLGLERSTKRRATLITPYGRAVSTGPLVITLYPAGHCLGSAQTHIRHGNRTYWYTGPRSIYSALLDVDAADDPESCQWLILSTDTMSSAPVPTHPRDTLDIVTTRAQTIIAEGRTPVLLCAPIGDAQEIATGLHERGLPHAADPTVRRYNHICREFGLAVPPSSTFRRPITPKVPILWSNTAVHRLDPSRLPDLCVLTVGPNRPTLPPTLRDIDHIDFCRGPTIADLVDWVTTAQPDSVLVSGPLQDTVAAALNARGVSANCVNRQPQLWLNL